MVRIDDDGDLRVVTLDRPERRNALTRATLSDLANAIADTDAPVVYLRGAGETFCAGADLSVVAELADDGDVESFVRRGRATADAIASASSVVVAGVDGPARGGGVELALACDFRVATPAATFAEPGVEFGLFGAWGGTARLPEIVGLGDALDLSLSGRVLDAEAAHRIGLVSRVVDYPGAVARALTDNDALAMERLKRRLRDRRPPGAQADAELDAFEALVAAHADELREFDE